MSDVLIAGAGPGGAALGLMLAQRGVRVTVVERHIDFSREFRGERVMPGGIEIFHALGLGPAMRAIPQLKILGTDVYIDGTFRYGFPFVDEAHAATYLPQPAVLEAIAAAGARLPTFELRRGVTVRDVAWDSAGRIRGLVLEQDGTRREHHASLVIGADGRGSVVRRKARPDPSERVETEAADIVWAAVPAPPGYNESHRARMFLAQSGKLVFTLPAPDESIQIGYMIDKGTYGHLRRDGDRWFDDIVATVHPELGAYLIENRDRMTHTVLDIVCYDLERWWRPGLLLIGDAAHPMSPAGGQGIGMALRDAVVVSNVLAPLMRDGGSPMALDAACADIQAQRRPEIERIQAIQRTTASMYQQKTLKSRILARHVAPLIARVAPKRLARSVGGRREITHGVADVHLDPPRTFPFADTGGNT